ncbi:MAG: (2Fe-2S) ferredoxin domain-containing protein [Gordonia sp. (in: high G+C Gram-positive bacteria)]|uniref:(2Fe-2S) ferredoxin domain-containing protein n=1 Tax=Gordonia sp. (in: high G+C Gram-positive bacteria) TaxID=84139 RepID=UPI003BB4EF9B
MTADWVIVTAPTDRGHRPATVLAPALAELRTRYPAIVFRLAVQGGSDTPITEALDDAAAAGAQSVLLVSGQTLGDAKQDSWLARIVGHWLRLQPVGAPQVRIAPLLTSQHGFVDLLGEAVAHGGTPARQTTAPIQSPAWENVPECARHVLVCRGPRCSVEGARETSETLTAVLADRGLDDDAVLATVTGCLFPCGQAPVLVVYPDGDWYSGMRPDRIARLVDEHLVRGRPVDEWVKRRLDRA